MRTKDNILKNMLKRIIEAACIVAMFMIVICLSGSITVDAAISTATPTVGTEVTQKPSTTQRPVSSAGPTSGTNKNPANKEDLEKKDYLTLADVNKLIINFDEKSYAVIENNTVNLGITTNVPEKFMRLKYAVKGYCAGMITSGFNKTEISVNGYEEGTASVEAVLSVEYCDSEGVNIGTKDIKVSVPVKVLPIRNLTLDIGEQFTYDYTNYDNYSGMTYSFSNQAVASINANGVLTANSDGYTDVYLTGKDNTRINVGSLTVNKLGITFAESTVSRAVGSGAYPLTVNNVPLGYNIMWSSSNTAVAQVDTLGRVTPISVGETVITATAISATGVKVPFNCTFTVTNPTLNIIKSNIAKNCDLSLSISGSMGKAEWVSLQPKIATVYSDNYYSPSSSELLTAPHATVRGIKTGTTLVNVSIDGIILSCNITVTNPKLSKSFFVLSKSTKAILKLKGLNSESNVKYSAVNGSIASVSGKGVIKSKKYGFTLIKIEVDGAVLSASVNIGTKKGVKAVLNALKVEGAVYSQARRMQRGYYDCSSLVWRSFSPVGATFGNRRYAPVAASEANFCVTRNKSVPVKYVNKLNKLRPGDLFFFKGKKNGRYKNIYHVAIYMGQEGISEYGSTYTSGRIIHANGYSVTQSYMYNQSNVAVIGRVFK